jgi:hypothetical protein
VPLHAATIVGEGSPLLTILVADGHEGYALPSSVAGGVAFVGMTGDHAAMEAGGFYNRNSAPQAAGIALLSPIWATACERVELGDGSVRILDLASSQGRNSMAPMAMAIETVRRRAGMNRAIEIIHTDLPSNDFTALFDAVLTDPSSYLVGRTGVFPAAIGRSYFEALVPPETVHLAWNTWSMQWMSHVPGFAPDHVLAGMSKEGDLLAAVASAQMEDWTRFLALRARELLPSGRLLTAFTARTEEETGWEWLLGELWASILDLVADHLLDAGEAERMTIPIGLRRLDDLRRPFSSGGVFEGLIAEQIDLERVDDPHWADYTRTGAGKTFATRHAEATRAWAGPTLARALNPERNGPATLDLLFARHAERLAASPRQHRPYMAFALLVKAEAPEAGSR